MRVWIVTSEVAPFSKSGGLGDVCGSLPRALRALGADVSVVAPLYRSVRTAGIPLHSAGVRIYVPVGHRDVPVDVERTHLPESDVPVYFLRMDYFYDRPHLYGPPGGEYHDNCDRFVLLCRGALELIRALGRPPDIVHAHDWHAGLVPVYMRTIYAREYKRTGAVFTIHNLAYQGVFEPLFYPVTGLDWRHFHWTELEFWGRFSFLKGGIVFADKITTVSPTYAKEIQTPEYGFGLDAVIRHRAADVHGILNGIDYYEWDPRFDTHLPRRYGPDDPDGKKECKAALMRSVGWNDAQEGPIAGIVSRLAWQKGLDLVLACASRWAQQGIRLAVLGEGDPNIREGFERLRRMHPDRIAFTHGFREDLAHLMHAGCDMMIIPSRYEPCGLVQMHALRYGTLPVVRATGGLADSVRDGETGFAFRDYSPDALSAAVRRAAETYARPEEWRRMVRAAMAQDYSWERSAREYMRLYAQTRRG
jgi:starch synthase